MNINEELITAIMKGDTNKVKELVESGADVNARADNSHTALQIAYIYRKHANNWLEILDYLLEKKADINAQDNLGTTVMMMAVMNNEPLFVEYFIKKGADPNIKDQFGFTAFTLAKKNYEDIIKLLKSESYENLILSAF